MSVPERVRWTVQQLAVTPSEHVLEVGGGLGHAVELVASRLTRGSMTAIDRSAAMVARASAAHAALIEKGRVRIECIALETVTSPETLGRPHFDKAFAINVNAFWTSPAASLPRLRHIVRKGGRVYLTYQPPAAHIVERLRAQLPVLLEGAGFAVEAVEVRDFQRAAGVCVVGRRTQDNG